MVRERTSKILVADDEPGIVRLLKTYLSHAGYEVITAYDGEKALQLIKENAFDLILLDVRMPKLTGYEVCERIKSDKKTRFIPVVMLTALAEVEDKVKGLETGADDFLTKPVDMNELLARVKSLIRLKHAIDQLENTEDVIFVLAQIVEAKDSCTEQYLARMADYTCKLASNIGLPNETVIAMRYAGILHDIGKIGISESILSKPGKLTKEEFEEIKRHSIIGEKRVRPLRFSASIAPIVRGHHERWDGNGYPDGLAGEAIPIGARIVSIADAYDAMTTDRPYRKHMSDEEAVNILRAGKGTQWDGRLVDVFIDLQR